MASGGLPWVISTGNEKQRRKNNSGNTTPIDLNNRFDRFDLIDLKKMKVWSRN